MARATILSSLGAGLYLVRLHFDNSRVTARLASMATKISDYTAELAALEPDKTTKAAALNTALTALNDYINATDPAVYVADPTELNALNKAAWTARGELDVILHDEKLLKLKKATLEKETTLLNKLCPDDIETTAWCVGYNAALSGEIEVINCDYLLWRDTSDNQILHDSGVWLPASATTPSNALIHPLASSEHATWFNLCMAPASQRHAARSRVATLSNLSGNTCTVTFDGRYDVVRADGNVIDNAPIHPQFSVGQQDHYAGANIVYGTCHGTAFVNGDRVIVDLHGGVGVPTVIGFYSNPRACSAPPEVPGYAGAWFRCGAGVMPYTPFVVEITGTAAGSSVTSTLTVSEHDLTNTADVLHRTTARTIEIAIRTDNTLRHTLTQANTADFYFNKNTSTGYFHKTTTSLIYNHTIASLIYHAWLSDGTITELIMYKMRKEVITGVITPGGAWGQFDGTIEVTNYWLVFDDGAEQIMHPDYVTPVAWGDITTTTPISGLIDTLAYNEDFDDFYVNAVNYNIYAVRSNIPLGQV